MAKKKKKIKYKKERVLFGDILPYEIPVTFSNRHFYKFLVDNKIEFKDNCIYWTKKNEAFDRLIKFIFNFKTQIFEENNRKWTCEGKEPFSANFLNTLPFHFKISHKNKEFRELSVIHPVNQIAMVHFYKKYKDLILYYCNQSLFSIRKPHKVAHITFFNDYEHKKNEVAKPDRDLIELYGKEYENLKTFFAYKKYSNIHKFYESYQYQRSEKKYNELYKFDIKKCFDSIYTHSLSWAILNKEIVKTNLNQNKFSFGGIFDTLMQKLNYNETNGIIIGPEFSRIFAEILLQQIDFKVYKKLATAGVIHKVHYEVFRYVDDYFVFYNNIADKEKIVESFNIELEKYKLYTNNEKEDNYTKPLITELTIAKEKISDLLNNKIKIKTEKKEIIEADEINDSNKIINISSNKVYSIYFNSKKTIIDFKSIVKESNVKYKDILNFSLAIVDRLIFQLIKVYDKAIFEDEIKENLFKSIFINSIIEILDFTFFIYSVAPKVNTTIKMCTILSKLTKFIKEKKELNKKRKYFCEDFKQRVFKKIFDEISFVLIKNRNTEHTQIESLYLFIALYDLGRDYRLDQDTLRKNLNIEIDNKSKDYIFPFIFNYWSITVILFYIKDLVRYNKLREELKKHVKEKFQKINKQIITEKSEFVILVLDLISCPYLDIKFKKELLGLSNIKDNKRQIIDIIERRQIWFTKWTNFDFEKEFNTKKSQEVY